MDTKTLIIGAALAGFLWYAMKSNKPNGRVDWETLRSKDMGRSVINPQLGPAAMSAGVASARVIR